MIKTAFFLPMRIQPTSCWLCPTDNMKIQGKHISGEISWSRTRWSCHALTHTVSQNIVLTLETLSLRILNIIHDQWHFILLILFTFLLRKLYHTKFWTNVIVRKRAFICLELKKSLPGFFLHITFDMKSVSLLFNSLGPLSITLKLFLLWLYFPFHSSKVLNKLNINYLCNKLWCQ